MTHLPISQLLVQRLRLTDSLEHFSEGTPPVYSSLVGGSAAVTLAPAGMSCSVITPAAGGVVGYQGTLNWACTGPFLPGERGIFAFEITVDD